jgi:hypothetical protein
MLDTPVNLILVDDKGSRGTSEHFHTLKLCFAVIDKRWPENVQTGGDDFPDKPMLVWRHSDDLGAVGEAPVAKPVAEIHADHRGT